MLFLATSHDYQVVRTQVGVEKSPYEIIKYFVEFWLHVDRVLFRCVSLANGMRSVIIHRRTIPRWKVQGFTGPDSGSTEVQFALKL
jgi:hypothetical protein